MRMCGKLCSMKNMAMSKGCQSVEKLLCDFRNGEGWVTERRSLWDPR